MRTFGDFVKGIFDDMMHGYSYDKRGNRLDQEVVIESDGKQGFPDGK